MIGKYPHPTGPSVASYEPVTELPGTEATEEQMARLYQRYHLAADYSKNRRVLEVACGAGIGLGYIAEGADFTVGGDYTASLLQLASSHYGDRVPLVRFDAHSLPFQNQSFDLLIIFEAIYYFADVESFFREAKRVLGPSGTLIVGSVNCNWSGFAPSPFSTAYLTAAELERSLLKAEFQNLRFFGGFPTSAKSVSRKVVEKIRSMAVKLDLIPGTLKARARLKSVFYGPLKPIPWEMRKGTAELTPVERLDTDGEPFKIIYCVAGGVPSTVVQAAPEPGSTVACREGS